MSTEYLEEEREEKQNSQLTTTAKASQSQICFFNGEFVERKEVSISPDDRGFVFSDGLYEVVRVYNGELFFANKHLERLKRGIKFLEFKCNIDNLEFIGRELLRLNRLTDAIFYIQISRGVARRCHSFPSHETRNTIYAYVQPYVFNDRQWNLGVKSITVQDTRWLHCDIKTTSLIVNILAHEHAKRHGADDAIFIRDGEVTESSHANVMAVIDNVLITPPRSNLILDGVTRSLVLDICKQRGKIFEERSLNRHELINSEEVFLTGTTIEIAPVVEIDKKKIGTGMVGSFTRSIQNYFREITKQ